MFGLIMIEVCDVNHACTEALFHLETEFPGVSVMETACMSHCTLCAMHPYVMVNGEIIKGNSVDEVLDNVRTEIKRIFSIYETDSETS